MVLSSGTEGHALTGIDDVVLGTVTNLLFHPSESRVIGVAVRPPAALAVVERPGTYLPLEVLTFGPGGASSPLAKLPSTRKGTEGLGYDPELTVIWTGMPVVGPEGAEIGVVSDVAFDGSTGAVERIDIGGGALADVAHGRFIVPGDAVVGYREGAVRITAALADLEGSGGFAKTAAEGAIAASQAVHAAGEAVVGASGAAGRAIRAVADADLAKRAAGSVKRTWRDSVKAFREGMKDDE